MKKAILVILATLALPLLGHAEQVTLGRARIGDFEGHRYVTVAPAVCGITSVRIQVEQDWANIRTLAVRFGNQEVQTLDIRNNFSPNSTSGWKDLNGAARCITGFYLDADTPNNGRSAIITLIGMKNGGGQQISCSGDYVLRTRDFQGRMYVASLQINENTSTGSVQFGGFPYAERIVRVNCPGNNVSFVRETIQPAGSQVFQGQLRMSPTGKVITGTWSGTGGSGSFTAEPR